MEVKKKAFLLTGHANWGKSKTLSDKSFAGKCRHINIKGNSIVIIKMSNDDQLDKIIQAIEKYINEQFIIIAFCPNFDDKHFTVDVLNLLKKHDYEIFSFVLKHKYNKPETTVTSDEINKLNEYSKVEIYSEKNAEANIRAEKFKKYIEKNLP